MCACPAPRSVHRTALTGTHGGQMQKTYAAALQTIANMNKAVDALFKRTARLS
jgi:hypothetical protein